MCEHQWIRGTYDPCETARLGGQCGWVAPDNRHIILSAATCCTVVKCTCSRCKHECSCARRQQDRKDEDEERQKAERAARSLEKAQRERAQKDAKNHRAREKRRLEREQRQQGAAEKGKAEEGR